MDKSFLSERLKSLRTEQGLSMSRLAKLAGVSQPFISEVERGNKSPTLEVLERICFALGVTINEFFSESDKKLPSLAGEKGYPEYNRICHLARILDLQELKIVQQLIEKLIENRTHVKGEPTSVILEEYLKMLDNK